MKLIILLCFVTSCLANFKSEPDGYKLELVIGFFRHGDRAPLEDGSYPKDPYKNVKYEPFGYAELTNKGKEREYSIGQMLRKRYGDFLGDIYKPDNVYAYSTDEDRTIMSLELVLAGLYPPIFKNQWNKKIKWEPAVFTSNQKPFDLFSILFICREYVALWNQRKFVHEIRDEIKDDKDFFKFLAKKSGLPNHLLLPALLYSTLRAQKSYGLELPEWCTEDVFNKIEKWSTWTFEILVYTNDMKKMIAGPVIKRFLNNIEESESKENTKQIYLYSASDINLVQFLHAQNMSYPLVDYGSTVILEKLRGKDDKIYIRYLFWSNIEQKMNVLKVPNCDEICPLSKYLEIFKDIIPVKKGTECLYGNAKRNVKHLINGKASEQNVINEVGLVLPFFLNPLSTILDV